MKNCRGANWPTSSFRLTGSTHYYAGEPIKVDHLNRSFVLCADRTNKQNRSHFDLPAAATMLRYGAIYYHGAPAALSDIPLGTHLHGLVYLKEPNDKTPPLEGWHDRRSCEVDTAPTVCRKSGLTTKAAIWLPLTS